MRVAYYSPLPPDRSGIAEYSAFLLPALARRLDVAVMRRGKARPPRGTDVCLYHVGNNPATHDWIVEALRRRRGVVVLHDFALHHLVAGMTLGRGDGPAYVEAMHRDAGVVGRLLAHGVIDGVVPPLWETRAEQFPLVTAVLDHADGVIVHSRYVEAKVRETGYAGEVWRIPMPAWPMADVTADPLLPPERSPVIGSFGYLNPSKRVPQLIEAFARLVEPFPSALLVLAGEASPQIGLPAALERFGLRLGEHVLTPGYVPEDRLNALYAACDVCVSLRWPTMGETSASVIRALSLGRPLVVSDVGWLSELPGSVAAKVPVDEREVDVLAAVLERLSRDGELRRRMGDAALRYVRSRHDLELAAELYCAALEEASGGRSVKEAVVLEVGRAAAEVGVGADEPALAEIAQRLREVTRGRDLAL